MFLQSYISCSTLFIVCFDVVTYLVAALLESTLFMFLHILFYVDHFMSWCSYICCSTLIIVCHVLFYGDHCVCLDVLTYLVLRCSFFVLMLLHILFYIDDCSLF